MNTEEVYVALKEIGCCDRCCLRYLDGKFSNFEEPEKSLENLLPITLEAEIKAKKARPNPCTVCLGLLEDSFLVEILEHTFWNDLQSYQSDTYKINLNTPPNILIREKAVLLYVKQKFPEFYSLNNCGENMLTVNVVFKAAFKSKMDQHCQKKYHHTSGVQVYITLHHEDNKKEVTVVHQLDPHTYQTRGHLKDKIYGKNAVTTTLAKIEDEKFLKYVTIPPAPPTSPVKIDSVTFESLPAYIAGRYCKYSRNLSQTPWVCEDSLDNGDKIREDLALTTCVQDIIFDGLHKVFGFDREKMTLAASGREDMDVRCLGKGRPFYVKIHCTKNKYPVELFRKLEETINESPALSVFDMQQVDKTAMKLVKVGEEMKKKTYVALCLIRSNHYAEEIVKKINKIGCYSIRIKQQTPIRVAHRRTLSVRPRQILYMTATEIAGHNELFQLTLQTQAGTYVKEFIHGDFGRTIPSLSELVTADLDVFRLDVIDIDLDWPPHINSLPYKGIQQTDSKKSDISVKAEISDDELCHVKEEIEMP